MSIMVDRRRTSVGEDLYRQYLRYLLEGDLPQCRILVQRLLQDGVSLQRVYVDLLQRALYEVGDLWAASRISVAAEHMASAQTEDLMRMAYPFVLNTPKTGRKAILSCTADEYHQIGGHMVADLMELQGWEVAFLGANSPVDSMVLLIEQLRPHLLGLSVTMPSNLPRLDAVIRAVRERFAGLPIVVGGQAFRLAGAAELSPVPGVVRVETADQLLSM